MKKSFSRFLFVAICITGMACRPGHDTGLIFSESQRFYSMRAHFSKSKMRDVEEYMDRKIGKTGNTSFIHSRIDGTISLEDRTTFYIKKYPGFIAIKLDKNQNSFEAYRRVKAMCEGIQRGLK